MAPRSFCSLIHVNGKGLARAPDDAFQEERRAMDDRRLQQAVRDELDFDPTVDAAHIGIAVDDAIVTLTGHVSSYAEKSAAERAARRVKGVRAVAQEIEVRYPSDKK